MKTRRFFGMSLLAAIVFSCSGDDEPAKSGAQPPATGGSIGFGGIGGSGGTHGSGGYQATAGTSPTVTP